MARYNAVPKPHVRKCFSLSQEFKFRGTLSVKPHPQIQRRPPTGIRLYGEGFKTEFAARLAGEKALRALVSQMRKE
jgi:hypothetical protein